MKPPLKTISNILDSDLEAVYKDLEDEGYVVAQRKKEDLYDDKTKKTVRVWTIKAKLNEPPQKPGRQLV
jgi:hypothetical protein